ncbi:MAG: LysE family transporter [Acidobacteriota bacterium]
MTAETFEALITGLSLGLAAGFSPGPLLTLVVTTTLERGLGAGARVAFAPLLTDLPIVAAALLVSAMLPPLALSLLSVGGGLFVIYLGIDTLRRSREPMPTEAGGDMKDLWRGALVNVLSPHPWLFWLGIGGPQVVGLARTTTAGAAGFLGLFYAALVGSKLVIAVVVARGRRALGGAGYRRVVAFCGLLLIGLGAWLLWTGGLDFMTAFDAPHRKELDVGA